MKFVGCGLVSLTYYDPLKRFQIMLLPIFAFVVSPRKDAGHGELNHRDLVQILKLDRSFKKGMEVHATTS